jgi:hypothetical protein
VAGERVTDAALARPTTPPSARPPGILVEPGERAGPPYGDTTQFKGAVVRILAGFYPPSGRPAYREFILGNARSIWAHARSGNELGMRWTGPFDGSGASQQSSALDALNAAAALAG